MIENKRLILGLVSLISLVIGIGIYLFFRNTNMLLFGLIPKLEFFKDFYVPLKQSVFTSILLFNLPDAFWFLSGILFFRFLWFYKSEEQNKYIFYFYLIGTVFEMSQIFIWIPGTFDYLDLLFMGIGAFVEGLLYKTYIRRRLR